MMNKLKSFALMAVIALCTNASFAQAEKTVGGAVMSSSKNIIDNAVTSKDHTTLVTAIKAAGLVETLQGAGPFTVFAPTNEAFKALPAGTTENLLKPENKAALTGVLNYHVVPGKYSIRDLSGLIKQGGGSASLKTVAGGTLTATLQGSKLLIKDENGGSALVTVKDVNQSNGIMHVVDHVLLPKQ